MIISLSIFIFSLLNNRYWYGIKPSYTPNITTSITSTIKYYTDYPLWLKVFKNITLLNLTNITKLQLLSLQVCQTYYTNYHNKQDQTSITKSITKWWSTPVDYPHVAYKQSKVSQNKDKVSHMYLKYHKTKTRSVTCILSITKHRQGQSHVSLVSQNIDKVSHMYL